MSDNAPRRRKSERRKRNAVISVRFSLEELERLEQAAYSRGMLISTYLREAGLTEVPHPCYYEADPAVGLRATVTCTAPSVTAPEFMGRPMIASYR